MKRTLLLFGFFLTFLLGFVANPSIANAHGRVRVHYHEGYPCYAIHGSHNHRHYYSNPIYSDRIYNPRFRMYSYPASSYSLYGFYPVGNNVSVRVRL